MIKQTIPFSSVSLHPKFDHNNTDKLVTIYNAVYTCISINEYEEKETA
jgi:hypothetical protein